jgi:hypothetical protein
MARLYVTLSRTAKIAAAVAAAGMVLVVYHRMVGAPWAFKAGTVLFFGGVIVYFAERIRLTLRARKAPKPPQRP